MYPSATQPVFQVHAREAAPLACGFHHAGTGKGGNIVLDYLCAIEYKIGLIRRSADFYSIGAWRKKHPDWFKEDLERLFEMLAQGAIKPTIEKRMPLEQASAAYDLVEKATVKGKIVLMA